jgi:hypothetical protein
VFQLVSVLDVHTNKEGFEVVMRKQLDSIYGHQSSRRGRFSSLAPLGVLASVVLALIAGTAFVLPYLRSQAAESGSVSYYVSPSGNDSNPGTQSQPFATISKAASVATPGTTVHVASGTYTQAVVTNTSGTATARIVYVSDTKWGAKLNVSMVALGYGIWDNTANYIDIQGFDMTGGASDYLGIRNEGSYVRIIGNRVHDFATAGCNGGNGGAGIDNANYTASDDDVIGNVVFNIGPSSTCIGVQGIYHSNLRGHILNNIVSNNSGWGIHCWHGCTAVTVSNNLSFNNRTGGMVFGDGDTGAGIFENSIISNNIAVNNASSNAGDYGISEYEYSGQHTIGAHNQFLNNLVYGNGSNVIRLLEGNIASATVNADPQFVNYQADGSGDYHLKSTSPAIGAGTSTGAPSTDFVGNTIPQGNGYDIGAYQYVLAATVTPTSTPIPLPTATPMPTLLPTNTPTPTLTPTPTAILNLIQNGSFENTGSNWLAPWRFQSSGRATIKQVNRTKVDGAYSTKVSITKSRSADSAVQLYQGNLPLTRGTTYTIVFWAKASASRSIRLAVDHGASPWSSYFSRSVNITQSWQQYTLTFTAPQTDSNGMLIFNLANATGYVWIDNVSLR